MVVVLLEVIEIEKMAPVTVQSTLLKRPIKY